MTVVLQDGGWEEGGERCNWFEIKRPRELSRDGEITEQRGESVGQAVKIKDKEQAGGATREGDGGGEI